MKRRMHSLAFWLGGLLLISNALADTITLKNGDKVQGDITSENDAQVFVEVRRAGGSIVTHETISKANIRNIERDTPEQKQEQLTFESLRRLKLDPNQECSKAQCTSAIERFNDFLVAYPGSKFADEVTVNRTSWMIEQSRVERGLVKLNNQWMSAADKQTALLGYTVASLKLRLADLQKRRTATIKSIDDTEAAIQQGQNTANNPPTKWVDGGATYHMAPGNKPGGGYVSVQDGYNRGHYVTDTTAAQNAATSVIDNRKQLDHLQAQLQSLEQEIANASRSLPEVEARYKAAVSGLHQPPLQPVAETKSTPPPETKPAPPPVPPAETAPPAVTQPAPPVAKPIAKPDKAYNWQSDNPIPLEQR